MQQKVREDGGSSSLGGPDFSLRDAQSLDLQLCMINQGPYLDSDRIGGPPASALLEELPHVLYPPDYQDRRSP